MISLPRARGLVLAALGALLFLAGCGGGGIVGQVEPDPTLTPLPVPTLVPTATAVAPLASQGNPGGQATGGGSAATGGGSQPATPAPGSVAAAPPVMSAVDVVQQVSPAVVTVVNGGVGGGFGGGLPQGGGRGTGFIIDDQGHIVTNEHVVSGGEQFEVIFANGEKRSASLVGADRQSDLAVVEVEGDLPATVPFGDSDALRVGQPVLAIGSPLGEFTNTVTDGIISSLERDLDRNLAPQQGQGEAAYSNLIQHNAAINPGNSGGPLFDLAGRVIGVNTLGLQQAQGLFFAIPSSTVARIASQLIETGRVAYPLLGINLLVITPQIASEFDLPVDYGVYVDDVPQGGPAATAGVQPGDFVVGIGGERIDADSSFNELLFEHRPGETVPVTLLRGNREVQVDVTLGERRSR